jgi:Flp pilus assembly protein TadG
MNDSRRLRGDRGAATTELAVTAPALLLLMMAIVQFGLWYHAAHLANAAAQEGARAYRVQTGSEAEGVETARNFLSGVGNGPFQQTPRVSPVSRDGGDTVGITVSGQIISVLPFDFGGFTVEATSVGPRERFRGVDEL